jgi:hypothetical protein
VKAIPPPPANTTPVRTSRGMNHTDNESVGSMNSTATPAASHNSWKHGKENINLFENQTRSHLENHPVVKKIAEFIAEFIPTSAFVTNESSSSSIVFVFPFETISKLVYIHMHVCVRI